jgi:ATP-dependent DNA helicase RecG
VNDYKKIVKILDNLESRLLTSLFYDKGKEACMLLKKIDSLLKPKLLSDWLLSDLDSKSISASVSKKLSSKGIFKNIDIAFLKPLRVEDYSLKKLNSLRDSEYCAVFGFIYSIKRTKKVFSITVKTDDGFLFCNWFRLAPYIKKLLYGLKKGDSIVCEGQIKINNFKYTMSHPKIINKEDFKAEKNIVYPSVLGMRNTTLCKIVDLVFSKKPKEPYDYLPYTLISKNKLMLLSRLFECLHAGECTDEVEKRLKYDEIFLLILGLKLQEFHLKRKEAPYIKADLSFVKDVMDSLEYELTNGQKQALKDILKDISQDRPMLRLLQGDVGCGKTIVALIASLTAVKSGYQVAFMAPTQPLAMQIYNESQKLMGRYGIEPMLLVSSTKNKKTIYQQIKNGKIDFVVGTHALIQEDVEFKNLGLAVIDEQHRFGVEQRKTLMSKGAFSHILIMSATPIPRSLSMVLYSKSSLSTIKEKPKNRMDIKTVHYFSKNRDIAYELAKKEMQRGNQVYVVAPLVEASENMQDLENIKRLFEELKYGYFKDFRIALLHGKLDDKSSIVEKFKKGEIDCLVSTTVVEVGIDAAKATVIIIESAERFGLSQLHQLRGRVGRNNLLSYALLITKDNISDTAKKRIEAMLSTNDGFEIAEIDYRLRGSGELLGTKQHGRDFVYADIIKDKQLIDTVKKDVDRLLKISYPINEGLRALMEYRWQTKINYINVG